MLIFGKKYKRNMEAMRLRNEAYLAKKRAEDGEMLHPEETEEERVAREAYERANDPGLEKGDIPAIILSAFLVFGPILLIMGALVVLAWVFLH